MSISRRLNRMLRDRHEIVVLGELALFLVAWVLGVAAAVEDLRSRTNAKANNNVAASSNDTGGGSSRPLFFDGLGGFE